MSCSLGLEYFSFLPFFYRFVHRTRTLDLFGSNLTENQYYGPKRIIKSGKGNKFDICFTNEIRLKIDRPYMDGKFHLLNIKI